ncbi:hypothetical protein SAMN04488540_10541 [Ferrimonas sediminum]|uniref:Uncharacterized protein n=1 Tax=Ferrimonas sediminum TaxID=718193 RepID=A0A1G8R2W1_9GAMM|nr:hypothetical protein [Ferrimonas sediminum]SDJ11322.1 hypothetical protein SAMN04488540_10541 [Ferrimonas sediminum]
MRGSSLGIMALMTVIFTFPSWGGVYCTDKNWKTGTELYKKYEQRYNNLSTDFNQSLEYHRKFEFLSDNFSGQQLTRAWRDNPEKMTPVIEQYRQDLFSQADTFAKLRQRSLQVSKGLKKSRDLWKKLADYCYDEDKYQDYKSGRNNMRKIIDTLKMANELVAKCDRIKLVYLKEVGFLADIERNRRL